MKRAKQSDRRRGSDRRRFYFYLAAAVLVLLLGSTAVSGLGSWLGARFAGLFFERARQPELAELRAALTELMLENARLREAAMKCERYRYLLGITKTSVRKTLAGRVLYRREGLISGTIVVDRGYRDGVAVNTVCLSPHGLVGIVSDVRESTCDVMTLKNPAVSLTGTIHPSGAMGIIRSSAHGDVEMLHIDLSAEISVGDRVYTSSSGGVYPDGLLVGSIREMGSEDPGTGRRLSLQTAVNFDLLNEVLLLLPEETGP
jgi:rod shape-determining protein MreC